MDTITAKRLHMETKTVLDQLEKGSSMIVTRNGKAIARIDPISPVQPAPWDEIMTDVWRMQSEIPRRARTPNPVLAERNRPRR